MADNSEISATETPVSSKKPARKRKKGIIVGVVAVVIIAAGAGLWAWHETPAFCSAICHSPMDGYYEAYNQPAGKEGVDKYGNVVASTSAMLAVTHSANESLECLDCHKPVISQQLSEATHWVSGDYQDPLVERSVSQIGEPAGLASDELCLNPQCHDLTRDDLYALTEEEYGTYNPHWSHHEVLDCGTCHKAHRASVMYCTQCHAQAIVPDGWLSMGESNALTDID